MTDSLIEMFDFKLSDTLVHLDALIGLFPGCSDPWFKEVKKLRDEVAQGTLTNLAGLYNYLLRYEAHFQGSDEYDEDTLDEIRLARIGVGWLLERTPDGQV